MENHAVDVGGDDNVVTYDDSNVVLHRRGRVNGNTGDTDTSGLNVVDDVGSTIRSGDSGNSDETPDDPPANPAAVTRRGTPSSANRRSGATPSSASVTDVNGESTATATDSLVIGGDGIDDNGVTVRGGRNVVTYDDGNVAIGGAGDTNAQIGDSDTGGAVTIGTRRSRIRAGNSFLPARQQAGAEPADPFDGDDPDVSSD